MNKLAWRTFLILAVCMLPLGTASESAETFESSISEGTAPPPLEVPPDFAPEPWSTKYSICLLFQGYDQDLGGLCGAGAGGSGGGGGGGDPPGGGDPGPMTLSIIGSEEYSYGHWRGVGLWYRVDNDADPNNRYYVTVTRWFGRGTSGDIPGLYHHYSDIYHLARGWASHGNTFLQNFNPQNKDSGSGQWAYTIGWPPSATYAWTQELPADFRYGLWNLGGNGWDDQEYGNRARFDVGGDMRYAGSLEYGAAGVVPTGTTGYMYISMFHQSEHCGFWSCTTYNDNTGWHYKAINWS